MPGVKILVTGMPFGSVEEDYKQALGGAGEISHVWPLSKQGGRQAVIKFKNVIEAVCGGIFTKEFKDPTGCELSCKIYLSHRRNKGCPRELDSTAILVSNLDPDTTLEALEAHFSAFGEIIELLYDPIERINPENVCIAIIAYANGKDALSAVNAPVVHEIDKMVVDVQHLPRTFFHLLPLQATQPSRLKQTTTRQYAGPNGDIKETAPPDFVVTVVQLPEDADVDSIKNAVSPYGVVNQCTINRDNTATVEFEHAKDASFACSIGWCYLHNTCCELVQLGTARIGKKRERDRNRDRERDKERDRDHNRGNRERYR